MNGAALASLLAVGIYDSIKLYYVWKKFGIHPFTRDSIKVTALLLLLGALFYFVSFPFYPLLNILLKSFIITTLYFGMVYRFRISEDVFEVLASILSKRKNP
jgi:O-antigen/teichoic acid export membrane protein